MKRLTWLLLSSSLFMAQAARADILTVYGQVQGGGGYGRGIAGQQKDNDFFKRLADSNGYAEYGVRVGAEVLFLHGFVEHDQYTSFTEINGTWTQFMAGVHLGFALGEAPQQGQKQKTFGQLALSVGYGMGTGQQVEPPLDNLQISDKGFVGLFEIGAEHRLGRLFAIGITVPIEYAYLIKNGAGIDANDEANQYHSIHGSALVYFKTRLSWE